MSVVLVRGGNMYTVSVCRRASGKGWRAVARYKDEDGWPMVRFYLPR